MNVTVIGTYRDSSRLLLTIEQFRDACAHMGTIVPNGHDPNNAEKHALLHFDVAHLLPASCNVMFQQD